MEKHKFWAWAAVVCMLMAIYTGYKQKKTGIFAAGVLFGTAGIRILSSKDAKKVYTHCTAVVLRAKECVMKIVTKAQENAGDIYAQAQQINEARAEAEKEYEDESADAKASSAETTHKKDEKTER